MTGTWHKAVLLLVSGLFIGLVTSNWAAPFFVLALLTANFYTFSAAFRYRYARQCMLWASWIVIPAIFFFLQLSGFVGVLGDGAHFSAANTVWLLGFPFYVLSLLSINHDIQTGKLVRPAWIDYALYGVYFPKFISGPVEQPRLIEKLTNFRFAYDRERFGTGIDWVILGVFCKFVVANYLGKNVDGENAVDALVIFRSVCAFELQVYFDLGGYSFMAYGISMMLGIDLTLNFNHPFFSSNIQSFWQRWHISLGRWFHEYVYRPVRSMDPASPTVKLALPVLVFLLSAVWHGQTLNFLVWGLWHGLAYLAYVQFLSRRQWPVALGLPLFIGVLLFGRLLFMESDSHHLLLKVTQLFSVDAWSLGLAQLNVSGLDVRSSDGFDLVVAAVLSGGFLIAEYVNQRKAMPAYAIFRRPAAQWLLVVISLLLIEGSPRGFIYARQ